MMKSAEHNVSFYLLNTIYFMYTSLGKFHADLKEQVIDPLNAWLLTDYTRMNGEILVSLF